MAAFCLGQFAYAEDISPNDVTWDEPFYTEEYPADKYIFISYDEDSNKYIEKQTIRVSTSEERTTVDFWLVLTYKIGKLLEVSDFLQKSGIDSAQANTVSYEKEHFKITQDYFIALIGVSYYNEDGELIYSFSDGLNYKWTDIIPDSYGDIIYNAIFDYLKQQNS